MSDASVLRQSLIAMARAVSETDGEKKLIIDEECRFPPPAGCRPVDGVCEFLPDIQGVAHRPERRHRARLDSADVP